MSALLLHSFDGWDRDLVIEGSGTSATSTLDWDFRAMPGCKRSSCGREEAIGKRVLTVSRQNNMYEEYYNKGMEFNRLSVSMTIERGGWRRGGQVNAAAPGKLDTLC